MIRSYLFALAGSALLFALLPAPAAQAQATFTIADSPTALTLVAGNPGKTLAVSPVASGGFTAKVTIKLTGLPTGVTVQPASLTLSPAAASTFTLTAASNAQAATTTIQLSGTSGTLTKTTALKLTVSPAAPAFSLTLSPGSAAITAGSAGVPISITANAFDGFASKVSLTITQLPTGVTASPSTLTLSPGVAQRVTLTAASSAPAATAAVKFIGTSGTVAHAFFVELTVAADPTPPTPPSTTGPDVTTYHYDNARDGLNSSESSLTLSNVNSSDFGKLGTVSADGHVDAQPLYVSGVTIAGASHNVLYVASEHGTLYAFDTTSGAQLWKTSTLKSGESPADGHGCTQISPEIGITATPVIDRKQGAHGTIFAVTSSKDAAGAYHQRLHALDLTTGAEASGSPEEITASYPGAGANTQDGSVVFDPAQYAERTALLLVNGNVYTAWTSHCDSGAYTGWVIGFSESTLKQTQIINLTPNGSEGAIWMAGNGLSADSSNNIYLLDGNGTFDSSINSAGFPSAGDFGNAIIKLSTSGKLAVADYFETYNTITESYNDTDLGSGGALLVPDQKDASGAVHQLIVGAGKDGNIYLANRANLGKYNPSTAAPDSNIYQKVVGGLEGSVFSSPAYFNGTLYYGPIRSSLRSFPFKNAKLATTSSSQSPGIFDYPGTTPAISANGTENGIVWAVEAASSGLAVLHAYDATNLSHELYNSTQATGSRDSFGNSNKFITPMIIGGRVYVGTPTGVAVFGLLPK